MRRHRLGWAVLLGLLLAACAPEQPKVREKLTIGAIAYDQGAGSVEKYARLKELLERELGAFIEVEPAFNEVKALQQIQHHKWSLVFAPPGLAAIAISRERYVPLFSMQGASNRRSVLVVLKDSPVKDLKGLNGNSVTIGQPGSAAGYYLPVYELYGLTLSEVKFGATPKAVLDDVDKGRVTAGALAKDEFDRYRAEFGAQKFRILHVSELGIPAGAVLLAPTVERNLQNQIVAAMQQASPTIVEEAGYITNVPPPDYKFTIQVLERVRPIVTRIGQKPAPLYEQK